LCIDASLTISLHVEYLKIIRRLEKEQKNYDFLAEKMLESERDLVQVGWLDVVLRWLDVVVRWLGGAAS
jgi:hypothetical protein